MPKKAQVPLWYWMLITKVFILVYMNRPKYSVIVPVFNRPNEVKDLLESLTRQSLKNFEVIIVEDGSKIRCDDVVDHYREKLDVQYFYKPNSGPGPSRNFGYAQANGEYFVVFDSDCIIPPHYFNAVDKALQQNHWDAWGGPDKAHEDFSPVQRAMGYTMSSFLTTGGIRGGKKRIGWFQPRSFNMGIARKVFEVTKGFQFDRYAEDIEFSIRMKKSGFRAGLVEEAYVYHKRRTNLNQFYQQVFNFGRGRAMVGKVHPEEIKLTHWLPAFFVLGVCSLFILPFINGFLFGFTTVMLGIYLLAIFAHSFIENKNLTVAILSVPAAVLQLWGYGTGFLKERLKS